jgi:phosphopantetheine adenylyltransferase
LSILRQAEEVFDKVIVALGINRQKVGPEVSSEQSAQRASRLKKQLRFHQVTQFEGLLPVYLGTLGHPVTLVRGVRDGTDLEAELRFTRFLNDLRPATRIVWLGCEAGLEHVSSSAVRELEQLQPGAGARYVPDAATIYRAGFLLE